MAQTTYRKFAQEIIDMHYNGMPQPEAPITQRMIAERIAILVAKAATISAFGNSNGGEVTYANDQFISVFYNQALLTDSVTQDKYSVLASTPAGLPNSREIAQVSFSGYPNVQCINCQNRMAFVETLLPPLPYEIQLYKIENGNIVFINLPGIIKSPVNQKLIGAVAPGTTILDAVLNIPKDTEDFIYTTILNQLVMEYKVTPTNIEVGEPTT